MVDPGLFALSLLALMAAYFAAINKNKYHYFAGGFAGDRYYRFIIDSSIWNHGCSNNKQCWVSGLFLCCFVLFQ